MSPLELCGCGMNSEKKLQKEISGEVIVQSRHMETCMCEVVSAQPGTVSEGTD